MNALLELNNIHAFYEKSHILQGVSLNVRSGEVVGLLGRNGTGRSTTLKAVMGQVRTTGSIRFKGTEILGLPAFKIAQKGVGYVPENRDIFSALTVEQNLILGVQKRKNARWTVLDMYQMFPLLRERRHVQAGVLSGGEQQMLALCRTLMGDPDLIMIDEPTEGLSPQMVKLVGAYLTRLSEQGISILLVEQKLSIVLNIAQRVYVMGRGSIVFEGTPDQLKENRVIQSEWLGIGG